MTSAAYKLFRRAILEEKQVTCMYNGHYRELCPHIIGYTDDEEKVLVFQFGGSSSSKLPARGEWRCLVLASVKDVRLRHGPWHAGGSHRQQQSCVGDIDLDINVHVRPARREQRDAPKGIETELKTRARKSPARKSGPGKTARPRLTSRQEPAHKGGSTPGKARKTSAQKAADGASGRKTLKTSPSEVARGASRREAQRSTSRQKMIPNVSVREPARNTTARKPARKAR